MEKGKIVKALSGFYYVEVTNKGIYQCRGRGLFRKQKITPLVGDRVEIDITDNGDGYVTKIYERNNELVRPPVSNIDQAIIVTSAAKPDFNALLLDRFLVLIEAKRIEPVIVLTKMDLVSSEAERQMETVQTIYENIGYSVVRLSSKDKHQVRQLVPYIAGKTSVIAGQSGVGKSSLLNALKPGLDLEIGDISESLGRGKHTTRHVEFISINDGYVADTPGFSSLDFREIEAEELPECFPEMVARQDGCKFRGCKHFKEPKCAVKNAVQTGDIPEFRYDHYLQFLDEIQSRKPRY
ncbi:ribosome small subunit-dependent GTPase A [Virgibacillus sp. MSP4-1]|uniref:ribosome small subunit-dependent GTPase A n=1 Tax=Virgibacillus sp. MSP4-1 TaxID=2700081 RepID=UPI0003A001E3|nr:ribosome small subunit-dependent GTPase A [Virgibacillus sp. MSP4-1]QHS22202.1 ribosome small subunit-dependent GTPase A [Virgibacillus sp. MSP4-1]